MRSSMSSSPPFIPYPFNAHLIREFPFLGDTAVDSLLLVNTIV